MSYERYGRRRLPRTTASTITSATRTASRVPRRRFRYLIGGHRPKLMRIVAEKADIWQWDGPIERYRVPYERLVAACAESRA